MQRGLRFEAHFTYNSSEGSLTVCLQTIKVDTTLCMDNYTSYNDKIDIP